MNTHLAPLPTSGRPATAVPTTPPQLSIAIVSYRRHEELLLCLGDLARQETRFAFEVVLILQAYPHGVADRIEREFGGRLRLRVFSFANGLGVHGARNAALARVDSPIVAFMDDDVRLATDWVETLIPYYDDPSVGGVGGFVRHPGHRRFAARFVRPVLGMSSRRYRIDWGGFHTLPFSSHPPHDQTADWLSGCNMSFRREALAQAGEFDEAYGNYGYDDVDMGIRVRAAGWRLLSSPRLAVDHLPSALNRPSLPDLVREEEARRVLAVRKAIGHAPGWRARYLLRLSLHLVATLVQGLSRGCPRLVLSAAAGARRGLARYA
jgi:GT2 family glycosyltransferase